MSMPPRSRTGSGPLLAGPIIALVVAVRVVLLSARAPPRPASWDSFFPSTTRAGSRTAAHGVQSLYDIVFYIAVAIFFLVEGLIVWTVFRYRRKPGDDELPPQTHGNNLVEVIWTAIPTIIVAVPVRDVLADPQHRRGQGAHRRPRPRRRGAVPVVVRLPRRRRRRTRRRAVHASRCRSATTAASCSRSASPSPRPSLHGRHPRLLRPEVPVQAGCRAGEDNTSTSRSTTDAGTYRGQCAELCGAFHGSMLFDVHAMARRPTSTPGSRTRSPGERHAAARAVAAAAAGPTARARRGQTPRSRPDALTAPADGRSRSTSRTTTPASRTTSRSRTPRATVVFKGDHHHRPRPRRTTRSRRSPAGTYTFVCTVHPNMTGTLTVQ